MDTDATSRAAARASCSDADNRTALGSGSGPSSSISADSPAGRAYQRQHCRRVFDLPGCVHDLESLAPQDFQVRRHEIILYGVCASCTEGRAPEGPAI
ncbi:MAG: hypothetical protein RKP20_15875 [Candidatus Competibacter sp.]|nr:hypothetical protein [Candidatus Competibacter sp.]